ncbi:MAG: YceI family protein [Pseudomonadota bacterium]
MIRPAAPLAALALLAVPAAALAEDRAGDGDWTVDGEASVLNVFSLKDGEVAEQHAFTRLSGGVAASGEARVEVSLASIATGIEIRDERMREMLFQVADWPLAEIRAQVNPAAFEGLVPGQAARVETVLTVEAYGESADYPAALVVSRIDQDRAAVSTADPIVVRAGDFGYGDGIDALRDVAGLDSISYDVPVVFLLVLDR